MKVRCEFERIGRNRSVAPLEVECTDADELAEHVWRYARQNLGSRFFDVIVNLEEGRGSIEMGRFGTFTVTEVAA